MRGLVQGVGFRPFVYRLAVKYTLKGSVKNDSSGVTINIEGRGRDVKKFVKDLKFKAPVNAQIDELTVSKSHPGNFENFEILESTDNEEEITNISPDIAVCDNCLDDMKNQPNRTGYPFVNCTNCGPRFTIIKGIPYDRAKTSMDVFEMCGSCAGEYADINDRRFHAQPVACGNCGPHYVLKNKFASLDNINEIMTAIKKMIEEGKIIAVKGLGGFNLICDAFNEAAVKRLREIKRRDGKPFAVMFRDLAAVKKHALVNRKEKELLCSWHRPVVILKSRKKFSAGINAGLDTIGAILPYMPFHYMFFERIAPEALVFTSGNLSDEPIIISDNDAEKKLSGLADAVLTYNRDIENRADDSVARVIGNEARIIRRSRGYVPLPVNLTVNAGGIMACGAEMKNTFCIGRDHRAYLSQHIGELSDPETCDFFNETVGKFGRLFRVKSEIIVHDLHPGYHSTEYARKSGLKAVGVQHHHAHIASCMAEYGLDEKVIGVSFDGTGYGDDGAVWGGEFFTCDLAGYERVNHLDYVLLPGGDAAVKEPWRMAVSWLFDIYGDDFINLKIPFVKGLDREKTGLLVTALKKGINCLKTSSAGRLFDAVSAMLSICLYNTFEAEAPARLESIIKRNVRGSYNFDVDAGGFLRDIIAGVIEDIRKGTSAGVIAARFHNTIIMLVKNICLGIRDDSGLSKVVLSGGFFQNKYILENLERALKKSGFNVYSNKAVPVNDGGLSLGQLVIAAKRRETGCV